MRRFKSPAQTQRFLSVHGLVLNLFRLARHYVQAKRPSGCLQRRQRRFHDTSRPGGGLLHSGKSFDRTQLAYFDDHQCHIVMAQRASRVTSNAV